VEDFLEEHVAAGQGEIPLNRKRRDLASIIGRYSLL